MSDIVERLRFCAEHGMYDAHLKGMFVSYDEAAVEIEKLRKDVGVWLNATADEKLVSKALREKNEELDANYKSAFQMLSNQARTIRRLSEENEKLRAALKRWEDTGLQKDWPITYDADVLKEAVDE